MQANIEVRWGGKYIPSAQVPQEFLDMGLKGIRAFAFSAGDEVAKDQVAKGNELAFISVDGYKFRPPTEMKRNIVWEFTHNNSQLITAVQEALAQLKSYSTSYAGDPSGAMAQSWGIYINGKPATIDQLEDVKPKDDVRITSDLKYARRLEAGYWTGTKALVKRQKRAERVMAGKRVRGHVAATKTVADSLSRKYKGLFIRDVWYEQNPFGYNFGTTAGRMRWPAIVFNRRKRNM